MVLAGLAYDGTPDAERGIRDSIVETLLDSLEIVRENSSNRGRLCSVTRHVAFAIQAVPDLGRDLSLSRLTPNIADKICKDCGSDGRVRRSRLRRPCEELPCSTNDGTKHPNHDCSGEKRAFGVVYNTCGAYEDID